MVKQKFDYIVIGSGAGLKVSIALANQGFKVLLVEKSFVGGTCLNRGCIPSKLFIAPADILQSSKKFSSVNLKSVQTEVNFPDLSKRTWKNIKSIRSNIEKLIISHENIKLLKENVKFCDNKTIQSSKGKFFADRFIIATGMKNQTPPIDGLENTPYLTSKDVLNLKLLPKSAVILGGGYIACELAHYLSSYGVKTTLMVRSSVLRHEDHEICKVFKKKFALNVCVMEQTQPESVLFDKNRFLVKVNGQNHFFETLIVATGQIPETDTLCLDKTDIQIDKGGFIKVDKYLQTSKDDMYALGDCIGHYFFRHSANFQAEYIIDLLLQNSDKTIAYPPIPHAVFSYPEIAGVGYSQQELEKNNIPFISGRALFADSNMGAARGYDSGLVKILVSSNNKRILGAHIVGEDAATLIHPFVTAITFKHDIDQFLKSVFIHPAMTEVLRDAAKDALSKLVD